MMTKTQVVFQTVKMVLCWNALAAFFFDFIDVASLEPYACTGFDLVVGRASVHFGQPAIESNLWMVLLLGFTSASVFSTMLPRLGKGLLMLFALLSIVLLVFFRLSYVGRANLPEVSMAFGYWLSFGLFLGLVVLDYVDVFWPRKRSIDSSVHIHIITRTEVKTRRDF